MKRLLKPTGQILTTAVFTATAIDAALPKAANPVPLDSSSPETTPTPEQPTIDAADMAETAETVAPPEAGSAHGASDHGLPTPSPQTNAYANVQSPLPAEFFADLKKNNNKNRTLHLSPTAIAKQSQRPIASHNAAPNPLPSPSASPSPLDSEKSSVPSSEPVFEELPPLALPSNTTIRSQVAPSAHGSTIEAEPTEDHIAEIDVSLINAQVNEQVNERVSDVDRELQRIVQPSNQSTAEHSSRSEPSQSPASVAHSNPVTQPAAQPVTQPVTNSEPSTIVNDANMLEPVPTDGNDPVASINSHPDSATEEAPLADPPLADQSIAHPSEPTSAQTPDNQASVEQTLAERTTHENTGQDLQETRDWLDQQLAIIVDQSRQRQSTENRQRLIEFARQSLEIGNIEDARQVASNPMLLEEEQDALEVAIAATASQSFIPLIPLDGTNGNLGISGIQPNLPTLESLPTLPTTPVVAPNPIRAATAIASSSERLPSLPLSSEGLHQWPLSDSYLPPASSLTADELKHCLVGDGDINVESLDPIMDGASPRITAQAITQPSTQTSTQPMPLQPMAYIGTGQQPPSSLKPSDTFPVGGDFLAGVGQQPPSILPESSWAGAPVLSGEPVPFKWTQAKLNQELEAMNASHRQVNATDAAPKTLSPDCRAALARQEQANQSQTQTNISGQTIASLTGYEWLSQFAIARPPSGEASTSQRQSTQMILPLPHATPMTSGFGWRSHPIYGGRRFHFGLDYGAPSGTPILASISGRIETTGSLNGYGLTVILENDDLNLRNLYAHMSGIAVEQGTWVEQGTVIGWVGSTGNSTGPHLHFEVHKQSNDGWVAVDPLQAAAELIQLARN